MDEITINQWIKEVPLELLEETILELREDVAWVDIIEIPMSEAIDEKGMENVG